MIFKNFYFRENYFIHVSKNFIFEDLKGLDFLNKFNVPFFYQVVFKFIIMPKEAQMSYVHATLNNKT